MTAHSRPLFLPLLAFLGVFLALTLLLIGWRVEQVTLELAHTRTQHQVANLREQIEAGFRLGLQAADMTRLDHSLVRLRGDDPALAAALLTDIEGRPFAGLERERAEPLLAAQPGWRRQLLRQGGLLQRQSGGYSMVATAAVDASGQPSVLIWLWRDDEVLRGRSREFLLDLLPWGVGLLLLWTALGGGLAARFLRRTRPAATEGP